MKSLKYLTLFLTITVFIGCKKNEPKKNKEMVEVVDGEKVMELPNKSDIAFDKALISLGKNDYNLAGEHIVTGVRELELEAKAKGSHFNDQLNTSLKHLTAMAKELQIGKKVNEESLRNLIANAEINVNHEYLVSEDMFIMTDPEKVIRLKRALDHNLTSLEAGSSKLEGDAKEEVQKLKAEGKKLKDDFEAWEKRAENHANRSETLFKKYQPEDIYSWGIYPIQ